MEKIKARICDEYECHSRPKTLEEEQVVAVGLWSTARLVGKMFYRFCPDINTNMCVVMRKGDHDFEIME